MFLFALPDAIVVAIFSDWVDLKDLVVFDTAVCVRKVRTQFMWFAYECTERRHGYIFSGHLPKADRMREMFLNEFMKWVLRRRVPVVTIEITSSFEENTIERRHFLAMHGGFIRKIQYRQDSNNSPLCQSTFGDICGYCPNVSEFSCNRFKYGSVRYFTYEQIGQTWPYLTSIQMGPRYSEDCLLIIGTHCKHLTKFDGGERDAFGKSWSHWTQFLSMVGATLTHLSTDPLHHMLTEQEAAIIPRYCRNLQAYCCPGRHVNDMFLRLLVEGCTSLTELDLSQSNITDEGLAAVAQLGSQLKVLRAVEVDGITDASVVPLLQNCRQLREINLSEAVGLTNTSYIAIGQYCPLLVDLNLQQPYFPRMAPEDLLLQDDGVFSIATGCPLLERLDIGGSGVTDTTLTALLTSCTRLTHLNLSGSPCLTGEVFWKLPQLSSQMVELVLWGCEIEMAQLPGLARGLRKLRYLAMPADLGYETDTALKDIMAMFGSRVLVNPYGLSRRR